MAGGHKVRGRKEKPARRANVRGPDRRVSPMSEKVAASATNDAILRVRQLVQPDAMGSTFPRNVTVEDPTAEVEGTQVTASITRLPDPPRLPVELPSGQS